ncbi:hypothetical protein IWQ56_003002, partial [Coemansia nantahalensis]
MPIGRQWNMIPKTEHEGLYEMTPEETVWLEGFNIFLTDIAIENMLYIKASLVAASCLDYVNNGVVDKNVSYDVYLDDSRGESAAKYRVESFTTHPKYSPVTFTNNLAVLQYNSKGKITWTNP